MRLLSEEERARLAPADEAGFDSPIPTQVVSSDEFLPIPQTPSQREVQARLIVLADELSNRHRMTRRRFLRTASGMAVAFAAMNEVYGPLFEVGAAEAAAPEAADERTAGLEGNSFSMDTRIFCATTRACRVSRACVSRWAKRAGTPS